MQRIMRTSLVIAAMISATSLAARSSPFTNTVAIDREVARFTGAAIGTNGGARTAVDARLRLASCRAPLDLALYGVRRDSVAVRCPDPGGWRIFVPLIRSAQSAPIAERPIIEKGDHLSVIIEGRGFSVVQTGEAIEDGAVGDWIRVQPPGKGEPIRARADRPGRVVIPIN
ncbi:MAG: flagella basal body P-ring formation protein FlgA [Pontixanthobacter sp.]